MKRWFASIPLLLIVGFFIVLITREKHQNVNRQKSSLLTSPDQIAESTAETGDPANIQNRDSQGIERRKGLLDVFRRLAEQNDSEAFRKELSRLFSRKSTEDPTQVLPELVQFLSHGDKSIRFELAKACIWAGICNDKVEGVLYAFLGDKTYTPVAGQLEGAPAGEYKQDFQKDSAMLLVTYRIPGAVGALWEAYQQTSDLIFLRHLSVFKDDRVAEEAKRLVALKKAKYLDLHQIFGIYRVQEAEEPLQVIFKARKQEDPTRDQTELAWSVYQITQKQEYYDYLVKNKSYIYNTFLQVPAVLEILNTTLRNGGGPGLDHERRLAFLSLLARDDGRGMLENYLVQVFEGVTKFQFDATTHYQVAAHLDSERVNSAAQRYEEKYGNGLWPVYSKRKSWPINDLIMSYLY